MYIVYVLRNNKGKLYKGYTTDLDRRIWQHNNIGSRWTHNKGEWVLVYTKEFIDKTEAIKYEKYLKSGVGREFLKSLLVGV